MLNRDLGARQRTPKSRKLRSSDFFEYISPPEKAQANPQGPIEPPIRRIKSIEPTEQTAHTEQIEPPKASKAGLTEPTLTVSRSMVSF